MKKIMFLVVLVVFCSSFAGCGTQNDSADPGSSKPVSIGKGVTLNDAIAAFENAGIAVDREEKPMYEMIFASDGVIFDIERKPVKLYEYKSDSSYKRAMDAYPDMMEDWPKKGQVVLETHSQTAIDIFNTL